MSASDTARPPPVDPRRYHEAAEAAGPIARRPPVCLYLETTNRCNLLCTTCPRTYVELEPPADMSWELFTRIVDQVPDIARVVLHGVGEPMLVRDLPRMVRYLKDRGAYVLFNTNGTLLTPRKGRELAESGLDELRVSLDAADAKTYLEVRGRNFFDRILRNVRAFTEMQAREGLALPRVSMWLTGLRETVEQLPAFVRVAHAAGVGRSTSSASCSSATRRSGWPAPTRRCSSGSRARRPVTWRRRSASPPRSAWPSAPPAPRASPGPA
jgi:MoaA/NifB/PqqE/SkfB family radical SAM enzyme